MKTKIRIGCGAGFSGDRLEPAVVLAKKAGIDYLVLECLAERTIALAQKRKMADPSKGYDPLLERRIELLLPVLAEKNIRLLTNMGAANPLAAAKKITELAKAKGIKIKVAAVTGDDVLQYVQQKNSELTDLENGKPLNQYDIISANAYLGTGEIMNALKTGAHIIVTGRVADPSLFLAPMMYEFGWSSTDYDLMAKGTVVGHLLECAGQVTGGYFADPVMKPVEGMEILGHPFADVYADGSAIISKTEGTGGVVNLQTTKEQLLYEVINPFEYITPDVVADFTTVTLHQSAINEVVVQGGNGKEKPGTYKASVGYKAFYLGEAEISYAGPSAYERAQLAGQIIHKRLKHLVKALRIDYIGVQAAHRATLALTAPPYEVRLRVAAEATDADIAACVGEEVEALYTNGPAGGGGVRKNVNEVIGIISVLVPRNEVKTATTLFES
jgi:hypothetical protein